MRIRKRYVVWPVIGMALLYGIWRLLEIFVALATWGFI